MNSNREIDEIEMNRTALTTIRWIAMLAMVFSGGVHLSMVPAEFSHSVAHGSFFLMAGLSQIAWAVVFWRFPANAWCFVGLGLSGGIIALWAITQFVSVPYAPSAEPISMWLIVSKMAELNGFVALVGYLAMGSQGVAPESMISWTVVGAVTLAIGFGVLVWGAGHFAETAVPGFGHGISNEDPLPERPFQEGGNTNGGVSDHLDQRRPDWMAVRCRDSTAMDSLSLDLMVPLGYGPGCLGIESGAA